MATEGKTRAPVDGKRLEFLEAGVSALAMALAANAIELKDGQDPIEQAIAIVKRWRALTIDRAELIVAVALATGVDPETIEDPFAAAGNVLGTMKERLLELEAEIVAGSGLETMNASAIAQLKERVAELEEDLEAMTNVKNELANRLAEEGKPSALELPKDPEPEPEEAPAPRERPEGARDVGPTYGALTAAELQVAIFSGALFELAFSNGEFEIVDFSSPAITVSPVDLQRLDAARVRIKDGVEVTGSATVERIHGCGLLLEGVQVAYHAFDPAQIVYPKHHHRFVPVFG